MPDVSVVIAVHNGMPEISRAIESVLDQTLEPDRVELIVVDDGSTDATPVELERLRRSAGARLVVVTQPPSGGPSRPRNEGLRRSRGRYVFFLDADDHLGREALERLVAMADAHGADVVAGKVVGPDGRSPSVFSHDDPDVDLYRSRLKWTLSAQKLFRRSLLVAPPAISFPVDLWTGEDAVFTMRALLRARRVSVLASYPCYYRERRPGGGHVTSRPGAEPRVRALRALIEVIAEGTEEGPDRDALMIRPFSSGLRTIVGRRFLAVAEPERDEILRLVAPLVRRRLTAEVARHVPVPDRVALGLTGLGRRAPLEDFLHLVQAGHRPPIVVEDGRWFLAYPQFRDPDLGLPDRVFELRRGNTDAYPVHAVAWAHRRRLRVRGSIARPARDTAVELRLGVVPRGGGSVREMPARVMAVPARSSGPATYAAELDLQLLETVTARAVWDVALVVIGRETAEWVRLGRSRDVRIAPPRALIILGRSERVTSITRVTPYFTKRRGFLSLRVHRPAAAFLMALRMARDLLGRTPARRATPWAVRWLRPGASRPGG